MSIQTTFSFTGWSAGSAGGQNVRVIIPTSQLAYSGNWIRVSLRAGSNTILAGTCGIGQRNSDTFDYHYDYSASGKQITFNGLATGSVGTGGLLVSDWISFSLDHTKDHCVHFFVTGGAPGFGPASAWGDYCARGGVGDNYANDTLTEHLTPWQPGDSHGYSGTYNASPYNTVLVEKIEVSDVDLNPAGRPNVSDSLKISEARTIQIAATPPLAPSVSDTSDAIAITENLSVIAPDPLSTLSVSDHLTIYEIVRALMDLTPSVSDSIAISEDLGMEGALLLSVSDPIAIADSNAAFLWEPFLNLLVVEALTTTDSLLLETSAILPSVVDQLALTDSGVLYVWKPSQALSVSDSVAIADSNTTFLWKPSYDTPAEDDLVIADSISVNLVDVISEVDAQEVIGVLDTQKGRVPRPRADLRIAIGEAADALNLADSAQAFETVDGVIWCGGEDIDFLQSSYLTTNIATAFFRSGYGRCAITNSSIGTYIESNTFPGAQITGGWMSFQLYCPSTSISTRYIGFGATNKLYSGIYLGSDSSNANQAALWINDGGSWTQLAAESGASLGAALVKYDIQLIDYGESTVTVNIYRSGLLLFSYTGTLALSDVAGFDCVILAPTASGGNFSEIIVADADTDTRNLSLATLVPVGAGASDAWTGTYTDVNEIIENDATRNLTANIAQDQQYTLSQLPSGLFSVHLVKVAARCSNSLGSSLAVKLGVYVDSQTNVESVGHSPSTSWQTFERFMSINPVTLVDWEMTDINSLQSEIQSVAP